MTDAVFNNTPSETHASELETLVGEGKKYKSVDELAKAYIHADAFIKSTTRELQEVKEELNIRLDTEDVLKRARQTQSNVDQTPSPQTPVKEATAPLSNEDLAARIREVTQAERLRETATQNVTTVATRLIEQFGDENKANEFVRNKAAELGVGVEFLQDVAARSPKAFFSSIGLETPQPKTPPTTPSRGDVNTEAFRNNGSQVKPGTYAYFENLRKTDPKTYFARDTQVQMHKAAMDAEARGESFF